jgi:D-serine deaminase-like pyridoxal phosphate-dependent protein
MKPLIDLDKVHRNIVSYHRRAESAGVTVRAHSKGHRLVEIAKLQIEAGAVGILAQTTPEARHYRQAGIEDIVLARPTTEPWRWPHIAHFAAEGVLTDAGRSQVKVHLSSEAEACGYAAECEKLGISIGVRIDVDFGGERGASMADAVEIARYVSVNPNLYLDAIVGYYSPQTNAQVESWKRTAISMAEHLTQIADRIEALDIARPKAAICGTVNADHAMDVPGISEICVGAYALNDGGYADLGLCTFEDIALSVTSATDGSAESDLFNDTSNEWLPEIVAYSPTGARIAKGEKTVSPAHLFPAHICPFAIKNKSYSIMQAGHVTATWDAVLLPEVP